MVCLVVYPLCFICLVLSFSLHSPNVCFPFSPTRSCRFPPDQHFCCFETSLVTSEWSALSSIIPVSYTHLDVYKRQEENVMEATLKRLRSDVRKVITEKSLITKNYRWMWNWSDGQKTEVEHCSVTEYSWLEEKAKTDTLGLNGCRNG